MTIGIGINALFFLIMGLCALVRPGFVVSFVQLVPDTADARNEIRAVYGGFGIVMALLLVVAACIEPVKTGVLLTVSGALLGMAGGRVISVLIERPGVWPLLFIPMEAGLAGLLLMDVDWQIILGV